MFILLLQEILDLILYSIIFVDDFIVLVSEVLDLRGHLLLLSLVLLNGHIDLLSLFCKQ
jgi:hypothetical protein